jgi:RHS repeat-associated protein
MRKLNESIKVLLFSLLSIAAVTAYADKPALPPGLGKYVMVLWPAGTPIPGDPKGTVKNVPEPDVEKLGGKLLFKHENRRVILLPLGQAKGLRKHESVVYLQRIWMGESLDGWDETYPSSSASGLVPKAESDENLQWGPKSYQYDGSGNIKQIGADQYTYDSAGRLVSAQVSGATIAPKTETYSYDAFGNLIEKGTTGANPLTIPVDGASNRLLGVSYDAAGNVTTADDGRRRYSWDSLNTLSRVHPSIGNERRMIYDASDERLATYLVGDSLTRWTFRDFEGHIVREFEGYHYGPGSWYFYWDQDDFYGEGTLMAGESQPWQYSSSGQYGGPRHYHLDHLGSVRMVTNGANPGRSLSEHDYFPFGTTATRTYQEQLDWANNHIDAMRFAGHWRDYLGQLNVDNTEYIDYMHARHYSPLEGRFLSPDPMTDIEKAQSEPQLWNRYAYVTNNPLKYVDVDGRERLLSRAALPSPVYGRENGAAVVQFARDVSHYDHVREASSGFEGAPLSEKLMAAGVVVISVADVASWFIGGGEEKTAVKTTEAIGFKTFNAFKRMFGVAGEGMQWHHIVEQTAGNAGKFGSEALHNSVNLLKVDAKTHAKISAYYSSKIPGVSGTQTVRQWLSTKTFQEQYQFGLQVLRAFGVIR